MSSGVIIPVLNVYGKSLPEAWEKALLSLHANGCSIRTQYDRKDKDGNFIDPPSLDSTMMITVLSPADEPRFHRCFPGGPADIQEYRMEVVEGVKDHWIDKNDKKKWQYTYHERLTKYQLPGVKELTPLEEPDESQRVRIVGPGFTPCIPRRSWPAIDQMERIVAQLVKSPYSRRVEAITWQPWEDQDSADPPCLQRAWFRILEDENGIWWLQMNTDWRSRDGFKAAFMNMDAMIYWMGIIAKEVSVRAGREVRLGRYCDKSDSFHVYGKDLVEFDNLFMRGVKDREFEDRTYTSDVMLPMMDEAIPGILEKIRKQDENC